MCWDLQILLEKKRKKKSFVLLLFFFTLFWRVRPQGGSFPQRRVWDGGTRGQDRRSERKKERMGKKKSCRDHFTLTVPPGVHYPDAITHAQTALFRVLLLIELLNDVESFKTNSVFCVWRLNDMDFHHCGVSWWGWGVSPLQPYVCVCVCVCVCLECVMSFYKAHAHTTLIIHPLISASSWRSLGILIN